ncbi:alginate export family protein [Marinobacter mobilis]|uniref:Alginate export n=1 Tax=Marinobacter mobilis TaxID=488533 RepID=A0A1H2WNP1_9GAMM|nr:alginate export family protein [Marinobacter mobilis]SDW82096.1 Alginate export [Marinobacter mobilis]
MTRFTLRQTGLLLSTTLLGAGAHAQTSEFTQAFTDGSTYGDFRLRYEQVDQDNPLRDADGLTLRSRLGYKTGSYHGLSGVLEFEDSRVVAGVDSYNDTLGNNTGHSVIADPETTEVDQAFLNYSRDGFTARGGRQVIAFDNQRFIGAVGWRQDRQTFDGGRLGYALGDLSIDYAYISQHNRIFAEAKDQTAKDNLVHASYALPFGTVTGYAYLLELDNNTDNGLDTYGLRFAGQTDLDSIGVLYELEYASQEADSGGSEAEADYYKALAGVNVRGITLSLAYEVLGSDDGSYGFSTPLATLHAFNGWADQFLATPDSGLQDLMVSASGALAGGKWVLAYHDFSADDDSAGVDDLGSEVDVAYNRGFGQTYYGGIKYAAYMAGDDAAGKVDTNKLWLTLGAKF